MRKCVSKLIYNNCVQIMSNRKRPITNISALGPSKVLCKDSSRAESQTSRANFISGQGMNLITNIAMTDVEVCYLETPIKSESDKKDYRYIKLPNGLKALLVHDPTLQHDGDAEAEAEESASESADESHDEEVTSNDVEGSSSSGDESEDEDTKLAACGLMVDVGSFSDPPDIQGLSHFLEHMIFMGSEKYPKENEYDSFLNKYNGDDNAFTDNEETVFYFEIAPEQLDGALDRFGSLFVAPLMLRDAMVREREAVDSEFKMRLQDDSARREQLLSSYGTPGHPSKNFAWGNLQTLKQNVDDDTLYERVHEYRRRHYSAHRMNLYLQSGHTLDEMENLVVKYFSEVQNNGLPGETVPEHSWENAFTKEFYTNVFYMKPATDINRLDLSWCLPSMLTEYKLKTESVVEYVLGHEGVGSLISYLRKKLWVKDMETGIGSSGFDHNRLYSLYEMTFVLTTLGTQHIDDILGAVFAQLKLLQNSNNLKEYFQELKLIESNDFRFRTEKTSCEYAEVIPIAMKLYSPENVLNGGHLIFDYNEEKIRKMIDQLITLPFNIMITKSSFDDIEFNQTESWFGTSYATRPLSEKWKDIFKNPPVIPELSMPKSNNFITTNFDLIPHHNPDLLYPERLFIDGVPKAHELWYKQDDKFGLPKGIMSFYLLSPLPLLDPKNVVNLALFSLLLKHHLSETLYPASCASLSFQIYSSDRGIVFKVAGFNQRLPIIVDIITKQMNTLMDDIEESEFVMYKEQQRRAISNKLTNPSSCNKDMRLWILQKYAWPQFVYHEIIKNTTIADLKELHTQFFKSLKVTALVQGNIAQDTAREVMQNVLNNINCKAVDDESVLSLRSFKLPVGEHYVRVKAYNPKDVNTYVTNFYQVGPITIKLDSTVDLLVVIGTEPVFDILRTKEQLGYSVLMSQRNVNNILGYSISVESQEDKYTAIHVEQRIENFRKELQKIIVDMVDEEFEKLRESLITSKMIADTELADEFNRNFGEIVNFEYFFDRKKKEVECIRSLTKQDVLDVLAVTLNSSTMKKLSVQVIGNIQGKDGEESKEVVDGEHRVFVPEFVPRSKTESAQTDRFDITNIEEFRSTLIPYDVIKIEH